MSSPAFLVLLDAEQIPQAIATIKELDGCSDEAWLVTHAGPDFLQGADVGDYVSHRDHLIVRLGRSWPPPDDPREALKLWQQRRGRLTERKEPPP